MENLFNINLKNKVALVCGSSSGIGFESAKILASMGAKVILVARNLEKLQQNKHYLNKNFNQQKHDILNLDLSNIDDIQKNANHIKNLNIDIVINNAGGPSPNTTQSANSQDYILAFNTHIISSSEISKIILPNMIENNWGRIINIISVSAKTPINNLAVSNVIRGGMVNWAKTLSNEVGKYNITVNNVLPGYTNTERLVSLNEERANIANVSLDEINQVLIEKVPMARFAKPSEVAAMVAFFASEMSSYITGQSICVDGGLSQWS